jgi:hypothetical protein
MAHPQTARAWINGQPFTLYYDYDQLRDGKLSRLTDEEKLAWFRFRMDYVFLEPLKCLYGGKTPAYRALNSNKPDDLPRRSFVIATFSVLLNGIEALGAFTTSSPTNKVRFYTFVENYMKAWDTHVPNCPYATINNLKEILWEHFRNGLAHGFCIEGGGIDDEADTAPGDGRSSMVVYKLVHTRSLGISSQASTHSSKR